MKPGRRSALLAGAETALHRAARRAQRRAREIAVRIRNKNEDDDTETLHVVAMIRNPADPSRSWEALFQIDEAAVDALVPARRLEAIGLRPRGRRTYELPDGRERVVPITTVEIEFMGELVGATVLFGDAETEPALGATALASAGIEVDPSTRQLRRLPAVRLKTLPEPTSTEASKPMERRDDD